MVAKITVPLTIKRALNYNENKVKEGKAECIFAANFFKEGHQLTFYEKRKRFEDLIAMNKRAKTNTVHISLNFGLNEKLEKEKLSQIASVYMEKIGFGDQPYLVYQHHDAGHPHVHIVTTNIQRNGKRISLHNLGRNQSTVARKEIEKRYGLIKAEDQRKEADEIKAIKTQRVTYGKSPTKRAITNVLDAVLPSYKYSSLAELNAILTLYNVVADRGKQEGTIYQTNGLVYRMLDEKGHKIGVPIKASSIHTKPTLSFLEKEFAKNKAEKEQHKKQIKTTIDWLLRNPLQNLQAFTQSLQKEKITLVIRQNDQGFIYGLTYIDHRTKCIFNGSDLGKEYSAKAIGERCDFSEKLETQAKPVQQKTSTGLNPHGRTELTGASTGETSKPFEALMMPVAANDDVPYHLKGGKKKRKRKQ